MAKASKKKKVARPATATRRPRPTVINFIQNIPGRTSGLNVASFVATNVTIEFFGGVGTATVALFRSGLLINMQTITNQGTVAFSEVLQFDRITVDGVCTGSATVNISVPTDPSTPTTFQAGEFHIGYLVL